MDHHKVPKIKYAEKYDSTKVFRWNWRLKFLNWSQGRSRNWIYKFSEIDFFLIFLINCWSETISLFDFSVFTSITSRNKGNRKEQKTAKKVPFSLPFFFVFQKIVPEKIHITKADFPESLPRIWNAWKSSDLFKWGL